jgi:hypothetical protein
MSFLATVRSFVLSSALALFFTTAGCQSSRMARINNNPELFRSLSRFHQKVVQDGFIDYGFSSAVVRMTLGQPSLMTVTDTPAGQVETWTYRNFTYLAPDLTKITMSDFGPMESGGPILSHSATDSRGFGDPRTGRGQNPPLNELDRPVGTLILELVEDRVIRIQLVR